MAFDRVKIDPQKMRGMPVIRDTRVTVVAVLGQLAARRSVGDATFSGGFLGACSTLRTHAGARVCAAEGGR